VYRLSGQYSFLFRSAGVFQEFLGKRLTKNVPDLSSPGITDTNASTKPPSH
jgi:hypothetical protein